ncbi:MAG TPA: glycosyltransferase family 39 protein [Oscillatoriaceae cyanobacterium]
MADSDTSNTPKRHLASEFALLVILGVWLVPFVFSTYFRPDEFTLLSGALRQLHGQVVYRDYFEFTAPLVTWLPAALYWLAGPSLLEARLLQAACLCLAGWQLYGLARRVGCGPWSATIPGLALGVVFYPIWPGYSHHWITLVFLFGALHALFRALESRGARWWGLAGACGALDLLTMQSDGVALLLFLAATPLADWAMGARSLRSALMQTLAVLTGALPPLLACAAYLAAHHALRAAYVNVFVWPLTHYKTPGNVNDIKWATMLPGEIATNTPHWVNLPTWYISLFHAVTLYALLPGVAAIAVAWGLGLVYRRLRTRVPWRADERRLALVGALATGLSLVMLKGSGDTVHTAQYAILPLLFVTAIAARSLDVWTAPQFALIKRLPLFALLTFVASGAWLFVCQARQAPKLWLSFGNPDAKLAHSPIFEYLMAHTDAHDTIAAMPFGGLYNFYTRPAATRYTLMGPLTEHYYTLAEVLDFEQEIERNRPKFVVIDFPYRTIRDPALYLPKPLPGYHFVACLPDADAENRFPVSIFERNDAR